MLAPPPAEIAVGYSLFAGVVYLTINVLHRTKDIDKRRDMLAEQEMELAREREKSAASDRDRLLLEIEKLRAELWRARRELSDRDERDDWFERQRRRVAEKRALEGEERTGERRAIETRADRSAGGE